jgi:methylamine dehydrogenase heavy chain
MSRIWGAVVVILATVSPVATQAQEPIPAEQISVEQAIKPGPNVFVSSSEWAGAGAINIFSTADLSYKGNYPTGMQAQFTLSPAADTGYVASAFPKRITYGPVEAVIQTFDVPTLKMRQEVVILPKFAQIGPGQGNIQVSADGARALIQNATPATSVTVVNLKTGKVTAEVPIPGCWQINMAPDGGKFSSLCGDGTMLTVKLTADGKVAGQAHSRPFFDVEKDPLFTHSQRVDGDLMFVSYSGVLYRVSDKGDVAELVDTFAFAKGVAGDWAPGGYAVMGYNAPNRVMFVIMHSGAKDGSHKNLSEELWAVDLKTKTVQYRSVAKGLTQIAVSQDPIPLIFGVNSHLGGLYRFEADPTARFAAKLTHELPVKDAAYAVVR